jgi:hypothetical protein
LLIRQLIIRPTIDALTHTPGEPARVRVLLARWLSMPVTTNDESMLDGHDKSPDLSNHCSGHRSGKAIGGPASRAHLRYRRSNKAHLLIIGKLHLNETFPLGIARPACRGPMSRCTPRRARRDPNCRYSYTCRPPAPEPIAGHYTEIFTMRLHRGERG